MLRSIRADLAGLRTDAIELKERIGFLEGETASILPRIDCVNGDVELIKAGSI